MNEATREYEGYSGQISVEDDTVVLSRRGVAAKLLGFSGDLRRIPLAAISDVALTPATRMQNGTIRLGLGGEPPPSANDVNDRNVVLFRHKDNDEFSQLFENLQHAVQVNREQGIDPSSVEFDEGKASMSERLQAKSGSMKAAQAGASRGRTLATFSVFELYQDRIVKVRGEDSGSHSLTGVSARVETAEELQRRVTATRMLATGLFAFALKKKTGGTSYLTIEGSGFAWVEDVDRKKKDDAVKFAAKVRGAVSGVEAAMPPSPSSAQASPSVDVTDQLRKLSELHSEGILTDEEFAAKKADLLKRL